MANPHAHLRHPLASFPSLQLSSDILISTKLPASIPAREARAHYLYNKSSQPGPIIASSPFVPQTMVEHLFREKRLSAIGAKYIPRTAITNMEGALHTFVTALLPIKIHGDYDFNGGHTVLSFPASGEWQQARPVVMSTAIHPDFEDEEVGIALYGLEEEEAKEGVELPTSFVIPSIAYKSSNVAAYDRTLRQHLIYHLTHDHRLPSISHLPSPPLSISTATSLLRAHLSDPSTPPLFLYNTFVSTHSSFILSLEMLLNTYICSLINELSTLEALCQKGYIYTFDPPSIFARSFDATLMNLLHILAWRHITSSDPLPNLRIFAFNTYLDPTLLPLIHHSVSSQPHIIVLSRSDLFSDEGHLNTTQEGVKGATLVIHNNSDGFGQNIESEGPTSLDGVIGMWSSAAAGLHRRRKDLVDFVF